MRLLNRLSPEIYNKGANGKVWEKAETDWKNKDYTAAIAGYKEVLKQYEIVRKQQDKFPNPN